MQERASSLTGLSPQQNPDYASSVAWSPEVGIARTKAYYQWRLDHEKPDGTSVEAAVDSAARSAFYRYALDAFEPAQVVEYDGSVVSTVPLLPRNKQEIKQTALYTQALWPTTYGPEGQTIHYGVDCPGATGAAGPVISLSAADGGQARTCAVCHFGTSDMGKTPAASTSIDNGYEYHLREYTLALNEYVDCRSRELELEQKAQAQAEEAGDSFEEALSALSSKRPRIAPPGRFGCVAAVTCGEIEAPMRLAHRLRRVPRWDRALPSPLLRWQRTRQHGRTTCSLSSSLRWRSEALIRGRWASWGASWTCGEACLFHMAIWLLG